MNILSLDEAFRKRIVKVSDYFDYKPVVSRYTVGEEQTGWAEKQSFSTEDLGGWKLNEFEGTLSLVAASATKQKLILKGNVGFFNEVEVQNEICEKLYSNEIFSAVSMPIEIKMNRFNRIREEYYLAFRYSEFNFRYLYTSYRNFVYENIISTSPSRNFFYSAALRPMVYLDPDIKIYIKEVDGSKDNPWKFM